jgi:hypothetical protein
MNLKGYRSNGRGLLDVPPRHLLGGTETRRNIQQVERVLSRGSEHPQLETVPVQTKSDADSRHHETAETAKTGTEGEEILTDQGNDGALICSKSKDIILGCR